MELHGLIKILSAWKFFTELQQNELKYFCFNVLSTLSDASDNELGLAWLGAKKHGFLFKKSSPPDAMWA